MAAGDDILAGEAVDGPDKHCLSIEPDDEAMNENSRLNHQSASMQNCMGAMQNRLLDLWAFKAHITIISRARSSSHWCPRVFPSGGFA
ncbi:MAG: hypothetical protein ACK4R3_10915 [Aliihoeflea sp.]